MAKADLPLPNNPLIFRVVGGVDESVQETKTAFGFSRIDGAFPFYTGSHNRLFGKKLIDANLEQSVMSIAQAFNGLGQFGYFVQTMAKLYFHLCETPANLFISYILPLSLGIGEDGKTLDIFGASQNNNLPKDLGISCVFAFPDRPVSLPPAKYGFLTANANWDYSTPVQTFT